MEYLLWCSSMGLTVPFTRGSLAWRSSGCVACRLPGCKEEKLLFYGGSTPVCCILAVNFLLRGRALLHIRLYCFSIDLQGRNYHFDIFFLRHSWILWIRSICYYPLLFDFILPLKCQGVWDGRRARLVCCGVNVQTYNLSQKQLNMVMDSMIWSGSVTYHLPSFVERGNGGVTRVQCSEFFERGLFCTSSLHMFDHRLFWHCKAFLDVEKRLRPGF